MKISKKSPGTKRSHKIKGMLGVMLVVGLILMIPLFFAIPIQANTTITKTTATPYMTLPPQPEAGVVMTMTASALSFPPTVVSIGKKPPACIFPLAGTTNIESTPENYSFSEPREPLPPTDSFTEIVDWLPDNQRVLLVQSFVDPTVNEYKQNIELLTPQTGETQVYATRDEMNELPAWVAGMNAVVYTETKLIKDSAPYEFERQIWISRGNPRSARLFAHTHLTGNGISDYSFAVRPGGTEIIYRAEGDKQLSKKDAVLEVERRTAFDPAFWDYRGERGPLSMLPTPPMMAWRPNSSQIFFYSYAYGGIGYTFLLDVNTGQVCELNFDGWALFGRWSPDGRYLAILRSQEPSWPVNSTDLAVLDAATGKLYIIGVASQETAGRHYVSGIAWAPDNHHLLVLGSVLSYPGCAPDCHEDTKLYLVGFVAGQVDHLLSSNQFTANNPGTNLAWSPDGSKVLALCPNICLISVQRTGNK